MPRLQYHPDYFIGNTDRTKKLALKEKDYIYDVLPKHLFEFFSQLQASGDQLFEMNEFPEEIPPWVNLLIESIQYIIILSASFRPGTWDSITSLPKVIFNQPVFPFSPIANTLRYYFLGTFGEAQLSDDRIRDYVAYDYGYTESGVEIEDSNEKQRPSRFPLANHDGRPGLFAYRKLFNPLKWVEFIFALVYEATLRTLNVIVPLLATIIFVLVSPVAALFQGMAFLLKEKRASIDSEEEDHENHNSNWTLRSVLFSSMVVISVAIYSVAILASTFTMFAGKMVSDVVALSLRTVNYFLEAFTSPIDTIVRPYKLLFVKHPVLAALSLLTMIALASVIISTLPALLFTPFVATASSALAMTPLFAPLFAKGLAISALTIFTFATVWLIPAIAKTLVESGWDLLHMLGEWTISDGIRWNQFRDQTSLSGLMQNRLPWEPIIEEDHRNGLFWALGLQKWKEPQASYAKATKSFGEHAHHGRGNVEDGSWDEEDGLIGGQQHMYGSSFLPAQKNSPWRNKDENTSGTTYDSDLLDPDERVVDLQF